MRPSGETSITVGSPTAMRETSLKRRTFCAPTARDSSPEPSAISELSANAEFEQELAFFNGHYDTWCYLPLVGTLTFNGERAQHLVTAILRPGNAPATAGARGLAPQARGRLAYISGAGPVAEGACLRGETVLVR